MNRICILLFICIFMIMVNRIAFTVLRLKHSAAATSINWFSLVDFIEEERGSCLRSAILSILF